MQESGKDNTEMVLVLHGIRSSMAAFAADFTPDHRNCNPEHVGAASLSNVSDDCGNYGLKHACQEFDEDPFLVTVAARCT